MGNGLNDGGRTADRISGSKDAGDVGKVESLADFERRFALHSEAFVVHPGNLADGGHQDIAGHVKF